jgi:hypothetical protein
MSWNKSKPLFEKGGDYQGLIHDLKGDLFEAQQKKEVSAANGDKRRVERLELKTKSKKMKTLEESVQENDGKRSFFYIYLYFLWTPPHSPLRSPLLKCFLPF